MATARRNHRRARCAECVPGIKWCPECETHLPSVAFKGKSATWCSDCRSEYKRTKYRMDPEHRQQVIDRQAKAREDNREEYNKKYRRRGWVRQGMDPDEVEAALAAHDGTCDICRTTDPGTRGWIPDHDHKTGRVRGIVCSDCNKALGFARDSILILESMVRYLRDG